MWSTVCAVLALALVVTSAAEAAPEGWSSIRVGKERVRIYRDSFGVPHVFARSDRGLFTGFGHVVAEDRLWQLELNRRAARGTLAEILGPASVNADVVARTEGYTDAQLDAQFAALPKREQTRWTAYVDGINRYLTDVVATDPATKLPYEFHKLGLDLGMGGPFMPAAYSVRDVVSITATLLRRFGDIGGNELANKAILDTLTQKHGDATTAYAIFNDIKWLHDRGAPATIPDLGVAGKVRKARAHPRQLEPIGETLTAEVQRREAAVTHWASLGVPDKLGSFAWVVSPARSREGHAMLHGGPQASFSAPEIVMEVQLSNANGFDVIGMAIPGLPAVAIGRNAHLAWSLNNGGANDTTDTFAEERCDAAGAPGYVFKAVCRPYDRRVETIEVKGEAPRSLEVLAGVHGPVVSSTPTVGFSVQRSFWMKEITVASRLWDFARATRLKEFAVAAKAFTSGFNVLYADRAGNIAYWFVGCNPLRPEGFDQRLPAPGDGSAEWLEGCRPIPESINPEQGWLGNWNNAPTRDYGNGDMRPIGEIDRGTELLRTLASFDTFSLDDMRNIPKTISRAAAVNVARDSYLIIDHLLTALDAVPPAHPVASAAHAVLASWDGYDFSDPVASTTLSPGTVIYRAWLQRMLTATFADELGTVLNLVAPGLPPGTTVNMLLHALEGPSSGLPPSRDYFNGVDRNQLMSSTFDQVVATLAAQQGSNPATWSSPRPVINFNHSVVGLVGTAPRGQRSTWAQVVVMSRPELYGETQLTLGQSGFIARNADGTFTLDPHFRDQLDMFKNFEYKPMPLLRAPGGDDDEDD